MLLLSVKAPIATSGILAMERPLVKMKGLVMQSMVAMPVCVHQVKSFGEINI